jgi:hypothetical protein
MKPFALVALALALFAAGCAVAEKQEQRDPWDSRAALAAPPRT